jgi:thiol-disulfide isomerase/thioredoxin
MKLHQIKLLFIGIVLSLFSLMMASCDVIEEPFDKDFDFTPDHNSPKILIEDFTGHLCVNCPKGAEKYHDLQMLYPDKILVVGIHGGGFAKPTIDDSPDAKYTNDFRTSVGNELIIKYNAESVGMPCALVCRKNYKNKKAMEYSY